MWSKRSTIEWKLVKDSSIWEVEKIRILPVVLKLSYDNLLPHLKRCFAYCCMFPKGCNMEKDVVIQLWVSNGYIPPRGEISLYVLGEEIFNCLVWRSFFHIVKDNKLWGDRYKMHDLIHDMAQHVMRHDFLVIEPACNEVKFPNEVLHLSSPCPEFFFSRQNLKNLTSLRSILMFGEINESCISQIFNHIYLRVLYLCGIGLRTLPKSICKLKHLRYLNLSESSIEVLPESIIYLQNLQVLLLCYCHKLCKLPEGLKFMTNLQCLDVSFCTSLLSFPFGINELTSLRILPWFLVGKESGAKIGELGDLNLIEGELQISGLENVGGLCEAKSAGFKCKRNLSVLKLSWSNFSMREGQGETFANDEEVLEGLEPNPRLKGLEIYNYMGTVISPSWMVNLENLVEIRFFRCKKCEHIPPLGRLPNLRTPPICFFVYRN
ncbi:putative leucine-rich repeat domain superfamily, winged helix-like DNA-binding domain superfamily [Helianthus annuus]|nr:putative leucine-rich repeat domain superfamily, winged helix-like DNA-binding domain superfamily [Helianthus annuus]